MVNEARPPLKAKQTWRENRLAHEERIDSEDSSQKEDNAGDETCMNMVFVLPEEFRAPEVEVAEFTLGARVATFEKPERLGQHIKPLFVKGYVEGWLVRQIMVDGGTGVNVMPTAMFEKMGFSESELMKTNTSLSAFTGDVTELLSIELTVGSKTMLTTFFVMDVKG
jgi:hypothetical protein